MYPFNIRFTKYSSKTGQRFKSAPIFVHEPSFRDAYAYAHTRLLGMQDADPETEYSLLSIKQDGVGGTDCRGGRTIWTWSLDDQAEEVEPFERSTPEGMLKAIVRETIFGDGTDDSHQRTIDLCNEARTRFGIERLD